MSSQMRPPRGGASVGLLTDLPPLEAGAVRYFRHWFSGSEARAELHRTFCSLLGEDLADSAFDSFGQLCDFCVSHGRRPLVRHGLRCSCLGADENCFANMLAAAAQGEREDAELLAALIVSPRQAQALCHLAGQTGQLLQHMTTPPLPQHAYRPATATLH